jgi:hypothetical protein
VRTVEAREIAEKKAAYRAEVQSPAKVDRNLAPVTPEVAPATQAS